MLLARAREIIRQVDEATAEVAQLGSGKSGVLRIGFVGSATHGFLPSLIKTFRARHPDVELTLSAMNNAGLKEALIRREIDGAIARPAIEDDEILTEKLHEEPLIVALPDAFEREWQQPLPIASLRDASFILYPQHPRPSFADHILSVCSAVGLSAAQSGHGDGLSDSGQFGVGGCGRLHRAAIGLRNAACGRHLP